MKRLAAMHAWPALMLRPAASLGGRPAQVGVFEHDERIRPSELHHGRLEHAAGDLGDLAAGDLAAGQGDAPDARVAEDARHRAGSDQERLEDPLREAGGEEHLLDHHRAAGDVGRVLEQRHVARGQGRGGEAEDLHVGEVPRHHRQHGAERLEAHIVLDAAGLEGPVGEHLLGVLGVVLREGGRLLDLGRRLRQRLAHLQRGLARELGRPLAERPREAAQQVGALAQRALAPARKGAIGAIERALDPRGVQLGIGRQLGAGGGVDGGEGHGRSWLSVGFGGRCVRDRELEAPGPQNLDADLGEPPALVRAHALAVVAAADVRVLVGPGGVGDVHGDDVRGRGRAVAVERHDVVG
jgi:uncharacterized protein YdbL (DUF1318 family)